jgi:hypothetical protein
VAVGSRAAVFLDPGAIDYLTGSSRSGKSRVNQSLDPAPRPEPQPDCVQRKPAFRCARRNFISRVDEQRIAEPEAFRHFPCVRPNIAADFAAGKAQFLGTH